MKITLPMFLFLALGLQSRAAAPQVISVGQTPYAAVETGQNHRVWQQVTWITNLFDESVQAVRSSYTELKTGLARQVNGTWLDCSDEFQLTPTGAETTNSLHTLAILGNLNAADAVTLTLPDGRKLVSNILGLSYLDTSSGQSVFFAETKDAAGVLLPVGNEIAFSDAFLGTKAEVHYLNSVCGAEQLVVLTEQPPSPAAWGLNPASCMLQVITEFSNAPEPAVSPQSLNAASDNYIDFGTMQMGRGAAFAFGSETNRVPVTKQWLLLSGRRCLVEQVPLTAVLPQLQALPAPPPGSAALRPRRGSALNRLAKNRLLPKPRLARTRIPPIRVATSTPARKGFAMDYSILSSQTNLTLQADTTYFINGTVNISGTTTAEGGAVVKLAKSASATLITSNFVCQTAAYRPIVFTASDSNETGENISGSTGSPTGFYGSIALDLSAASSPVLSNVRFCYLSNALAGAGITLRNAQFEQCLNAFSSGSSQPIIYNGLLHRLGSFLPATGANTVTCENVTAHYCTNFLGGTTGTINLTNCLFVCVTNWQCTTTRTNCCAFLNSDSGIFQIVGAGSHYLAEQSPYRNAGTTTINSSLLADLRQKTTYPPLVYSNATFSVATTFWPQAQRDTDTIDIGFEYDPIDFCFGGCEGGATLTVQPGTALGWFRTSSGWFHAGHGIHMDDSQTIAFNGQADAPDYWVRCSVVQEGCNSLWSGGYGPGGITGWAASTATAPELHATFLRASMLADEANHIRDDNGWITVRLRDSEFYGGSLGGYASSQYHTNCLYDRVSVWLEAGQTDIAWDLRNCTWHGGNIIINRSANPTPVSVRDCAFDSSSVSTSDQYSTNSTYTDYDYNAFLYGQPRTSPTGTHDVIVTNSFNWQTSWLGNYYLPTNSTLINAGSVTADARGLYHYTTATNQTVEGTSQVDIAYHYVAVDGTGKPLDYDSDGTPDYLEDTNGTGLVDSGETDWQSADELGLKVLITRPQNGSVIP